MLARLAEVTGGTIEVDRSGTLIRVRPPSLAPRIQELLGRGDSRPELLGREAAASVLASTRTWFSRSTVRELSP